MKNKKQTAVIGVGSFGKAHVRNYNNFSDLVAVCDENENNAKETASQYEGVRYYSDPKKMLKEESLDAVSIVTPPAFIPGLTRICASAGVSVLMEKPMGLKYDEVEALTKDFPSVRLQPGFIELYNPVFQELKDYLAKKEIGEILTISSKRIGLFPRRYWGMGVVMDLTTHDLYLHQDLLGEVKDIKSMVRYFHDSKDKVHRFEDAAYVLLDFGDSKSMIESNWLTPTKYRKMFVSGEDGTIEIDFITGELRLLTGKDLTGDKPVIIETKYKQLRAKEPLREELMDFLYSDKPKITLKDGLRTLRVVLKVLEAAKK